MSSRAINDFANIKKRMGKGYVEIKKMRFPVRADMLSDRFEYRETKFAVRRGQQM